MRNRFATKLPHEREQDATEKLVKPAPKLKPPRRDLSNRTIKPEDDPDLERSNAENDPDLSRNYKKIGSDPFTRWAVQQGYSKAAADKPKYETYVEDKKSKGETDSILDEKAWEKQVGLGGDAEGSAPAGKKRVELKDALTELLGDDAPVPEEYRTELSYYLAAFEVDKTSEKAVQRQYDKLIEQYESDPGKDPVKDAKAKLKDLEKSEDMDDHAVAEALACLYVIKTNAKPKGTPAKPAVPPPAKPPESVPATESAPAPPAAKSPAVVAPPEPPPETAESRAEKHKTLVKKMLGSAGVDSSLGQAAEKILQDVDPEAFAQEVDKHLTKMRGAIQSGDPKQIASTLSSMDAEPNKENLAKTLAARKVFQDQILKVHNLAGGALDSKSGTPKEELQKFASSMQSIGPHLSKEQATELHQSLQKSFDAAMASGSADAQRRVKMLSAALRASSPHDVPGVQEGAEVLSPESKALLNEAIEVGVPGVFDEHGNVNLTGPTLLKLHTERGKLTDQEFLKHLESYTGNNFGEDSWVVQNLKDPYVPASHKAAARQFAQNIEGLMFLLGETKKPPEDSDDDLELGVVPTPVGTTTGPKASTKLQTVLRDSLPELQTKLKQELEALGPGATPQQTSDLNKRLLQELMAKLREQHKDMLKAQDLALMDAIEKDPQSMYSTMDPPLGRIMAAKALVMKQYFAYSSSPIGQEDYRALIRDHTRQGQSRSLRASETNISGEYKMSKRQISKKGALQVTADLERLANLFQAQADLFGLPGKVAEDFAFRCDVMADHVERQAGIVRDEQGRVANFDAEQIGEPVKGPLVEPTFPGHAPVGPEFTQKQNVELQDKVESGNLGKDASIAALTAQVAKLANQVAALTAKTAADEEVKEEPKVEEKPSKAKEARKLAARLLRMAAEAEEADKEEACKKADEDEEDEDEAPVASKKATFGYDL